MTAALVLGAGGTVGMAYHAGALRALEVAGGFVPDDADLVIGTSAGSMMGALVRGGLSTDDLYRSALGEHPDIEIERSDDPWEQAWRSPFEFARRIIGSTYVLQRSLIRVPMPRLPAELRRRFPGGFFTIADAEERLGDLLPATWPTKPLWLIAVDVRTGRRVILGRRNPPRADLHDAVLASCAIPGFFQPIRAAGRTLVDGGVHSTTNVDLATKIRPDVIVTIVPMAFDPATPPNGFERIIRETAQRSLRREVSQARGAGARVLSIRPGRDELASFGRNMMRSDGNHEVARIAFEATSEALDTPRAQDVLAQARETAAA